MNKLTQNNAVHPQTVEIPQPLEVHPSVDPELAKELLRVASLFAKKPEAFVGYSPVVINGCGCIFAHVFNATSETHRVAFANDRAKTLWPQHAMAINRIYGDACKKTTQWAINTIEHFLRTGE